jgi:hypothetical protein
MALIQGLFAWVSRSAGKIVNAIFGWAVVALFGRTSSKQQTLLSLLVALAAAWPVLLVGIAFPKVTALVVAFVPLSDEAPDWAIRLVWAALAIIVPAVVGLVVASKAPPGTPPEPFLKRVGRGFPITIGIAGAFLLMFVTVPALRLLSLARGRQDEHVPLLTTGDGYQKAAAMIDEIVRRHGLDASRAEPSWWLVGPARILQKMGGKALRGFMPTDMAYWRGAKLELGLYPSDLLVRGAKTQLAWAHGALAEGLARGPGLQTLAPEAQKLELQIHRVWAAFDDDPTYRRGSPKLRARIKEIAEDLGRLPVPYDEWQVLYRELLQLARTVEGEPQLLDSLLEEGRPPHQPTLLKRLLSPDLSAGPR